MSDKKTSKATDQVFAAFKAMTELKPVTEAGLLDILADLWIAAYKSGLDFAQLTLTDILKPTEHESTNR